MSNFLRLAPLSGAALLFSAVTLGAQNHDGFFAPGVPPGGAVGSTETTALASTVGPSILAAAPTLHNALGLQCPPFPTGARGTVLGVIDGTVQPDVLAEALGRGGATQEAQALAQLMRGLTSDRDGQQLAEAIEQFNALVLGSSDAFLRDPSEEFLVVQTSLAFLSGAAAGRVVPLNWVCPPPEERPIQVCVMVDGLPQIVSAVYRPSSADTVVDNRPLAEIYPNAAPDLATGAPWFLEDSFEFEGRPWVKFGLSRTIQPENMQRMGEMQGTSLFVETGDLFPYTVLYVPALPNCEFQPYMPAEILRPRASLGF